MKLRLTKYLAAFTAAIIVLGSINTGTSAAAADKFAFTYYTNDFLKAPDNAVVPVRTYAQLDNQSVSLSFMPADEDKQIADYGEWMLSYPLSSGVIVQAYLTKANDTYSFTYHLVKPYDASDPTTYPVTAGSEELGGVVDITGTKDVKIATGISSMPWAKLADYPGGGAHSDFDIILDSYGYPVYSFKKGFGFSFQLDSQLVSFKLESDGSFRYTANQIMPGNIYDFSLYMKDGAAFPSSTLSKITIFNGVRNFTSKPLDRKSTRLNSSH